MVVRGPLTDPAVVVAGLLAPILAGATVVLPAPGATDPDTGADGTLPIEVDGEPRGAPAVDAEPR